MFPNPASARRPATAVAREPSILASARKMSSAAGKSSSRPPLFRGTKIRNTPIDRSASNRSGGIRRPASISAAREAISGANFRISVSRCWAVLVIGPACNSESSAHPTQEFPRRCFQDHFMRGALHYK
jgi:hypothetical protein